MRRLRAWLLIVAWNLGGVALAQTETWAAAQARSLTAQGQQALTEGRPAVAARLFHEALVIDGSYGPAYLALGSLREKSGDLREAEQVYSVSLEHVPALWEARVARGHLRWRLHQRAAAKSDLSEALAQHPGDVALAEELAQWCIEDGEFPRALSVYRYVRRVLVRTGDEAGLARARLRIKALTALVAEADVLRARHPKPDPVRRAIESVARQQGW